MQLAIGPIFFFIVNIALQHSIGNGFAAVLGVTVVDYIYIALAIAGVGAFLEKPRIKKVFGIVSSVVLLLFGVRMLYTIHSSMIDIVKIETSTMFASFLATFFLTISSPMTIVFWTSVFAAKAIEYKYTKKELLYFGIAAGLATCLFMGTAVLVFSLVKEQVPMVLIQGLNILV